MEDVITRARNVEDCSPRVTGSQGHNLRNINVQQRYCYKLECHTIKVHCTRVETLIVATIYLQLIQNRYMFRSFTVLQCSHQHCVQLVASDVEVVGYL